MRLIVFLFLAGSICGGVLSADAAGSEKVYTGIFGLWAWGDWDEAFTLVKKNGFDIAVGVSEKENLDKAHALGLKCIVDHGLDKESLDNANKWSSYLEGLRYKIEQFKNHPAVFAWYVVDEPDWQGIPIEKIKAVTDLVRSIDKTKPIFTVLTMPDKWRAYLQYFDIIAIDPYLKKKADGTFDSPEKVRHWIRRIRDDLMELNIERPVWVVLGAFEERPKIPFFIRSVFKKPTPEEFSEMANIALSEKTDGLLVWTLSFKNYLKFRDWRLPTDDPDLWERVRMIPDVVRNAQ